MGKRVHIIAAHPDDELLGCGGAILYHLNKGDKVRITIVAEGLTSRGNKSKNIKNNETTALKKLQNQYVEK